MKELEEIEIAILVTSPPSPSPDRDRGGRLSPRVGLTFFQPEVFSLVF